MNISSEPPACKDSEQCVQSTPSRSCRQLILREQEKEHVSRVTRNHNRNCSWFKAVNLFSRVSVSRFSWRHATRLPSDATDLFLLHVEVVDDDTDEEVEREEGAEDDEEDEVEIHEDAHLALRLLPHLRKHAHTRHVPRTHRYVVQFPSAFFCPNYTVQHALLLKTYNTHRTFVKHSA